MNKWEGLGKQLSGFKKKVLALQAWGPMCLKKKKKKAELFWQMLACNPRAGEVVTGGAGAHWPVSLACWASTGPVRDRGSA